MTGRPICIQIFNGSAFPKDAPALFENARAELGYLDWNAIVAHNDEVLLAYDQAGRVAGGIEFSANPKRIGLHRVMLVNHVETAGDFLKQGISKALLSHIFAEAENRALKCLAICYFHTKGELYLTRQVKRLEQQYAGVFQPS